MITLTALVSIILALFVILTLFFTLNKFLSVQNIDKSKTLKELSLNIQAMQILSQDVQIEQKELNYSISGNTKEISIDKIDSDLNFFNSNYEFSCDLKLREITTVDGEKEYKKPYPVFTKIENVFRCFNKND